MATLEQTRAKLLTELGLTLRSIAGVPKYTLGFSEGDDCAVVRIDMTTVANVPLTQCRDKTAVMAYVHSCLVDARDLIDNSIQALGA